MFVLIRYSRGNVWRHLAGDTIKITLTAIIIQTRTTTAYMLHCLLHFTTVFTSHLHKYIQKLRLNHVILIVPVSQNIYERKVK